ncbi:hypothetical protein BD779DRAFT_1403162, partial [Infundibulicybe gibba]
FDVPKLQANEVLLEAERELRLLADGLDIEEPVMMVDIEGDDDDDVDGLVDEREERTVADQIALDASIRPVKLVLVKLRKLAYAIKNSSTIVLPAWRATLKSLGLSDRMMPRDVSTRWNSTFDMLMFALNYKEALNSICSNIELNL